MEVSQVNNRLRSAIDVAKARAQSRRQTAAAAEKAYEVFLETVATPLARQVANALKVAGIGFTLGTPGGGLRLAADRGRDDFIEFVFDASGEVPQAAGRVAIAQRRIAGAIRAQDSAQAEDWMSKHIRDFRRGFEVAGIGLERRVGNE